MRCSCTRIGQHLVPNLRLRCQEKLSTIFNSLMPGMVKWEINSLQIYPKKPTMKTSIVNKSSELVIDHVRMMLNMNRSISIDHGPNVVPLLCKRYLTLWHNDDSRGSINTT